MVLIPLNRDKETISNRFRKAECFAIIKDNSVKILENSYKKSKSEEFFIFFNTLNTKEVYLKNIGVKTFNKLDGLGIDVYIIEVNNLSEINVAKKIKLNSKNIKEYATLGHS